MKSFRNLLLALAALSGASLAGAHPGHGVSDPGSLLHYLLEPLHLAITALVLVALGVTILAVRRVRLRGRRPPRQ